MPILSPMFQEPLWDASRNLLDGAAYFFFRHLIWSDTWERPSSKTNFRPTVNASAICKIGVLVNRKDEAAISQYKAPRRVALFPVGGAVCLTWLSIHLLLNLRSAMQNSSGDTRSKADFPLDKLLLFLRGPPHWLPLSRVWIHYATISR